MEHTMPYIITIVEYINHALGTQSIELFNSEDAAREFILNTCHSFFAVDFFAHSEDIQDAVERLQIATFNITQKTITIHH